MPKNAVRIRCCMAADDCLLMIEALHWNFSRDLKYQAELLYHLHSLLNHWGSIPCVCPVKLQIRCFDELASSSSLLFTICRQLNVIPSSKSIVYVPDRLAMPAAFTQESSKSQVLSVALLSFADGESTANARCEANKISP
jgi:hypothetical protein